MSCSRSRAVAGAAILTLLPAGVMAQQAGPESFVVRRGGDTLAVENFTRAPGRLEGTLTLSPALGGTRVAYVATIAADESVPRLELKVGPASAAAGQGRSVTIELKGDTAVVQAAGAPQKLATKPGAFPHVNLSFALLEQAIRRARKLGPFPVELPLFVSGQTVSATVSSVGGDTVAFTVGGVELRAVVDPSGRVVSGSVPSQGLTIERSATRVAAPAAPKPDYSAPAGAAYTAEEVTVPGPTGTLAGTLTMPKARKGKVPAVVTITGSGPEDRDEAIPPVEGYRPFRQVADTLSRRGIAVLRLDDRGTGASKGNFATATSEDFAKDIEAAVRWLRSRPDIDATRIALVGHSEGGLIAPLVASQDSTLRGIVLMAGPAQTGRQIITFQQRYAVEHDTTLTAAKRDSILAASKVTIDTLATHNVWMRFFLDHDPLATARKVDDVPVLILQGATDQQVTAEQAQALGAAFREGGNKDVTVHVFPDHNHLFLRDPSGNPSGYAKLPVHRIDGEVMGTLADWLVARLK